MTVPKREVQHYCLRLAGRYLFAMMVAMIAGLILDGKVGVFLYIVTAACGGAAVCALIVTERFARES